MQKNKYTHSCFSQSSRTPRAPIERARSSAHISARARPHLLLRHLHTQRAKRRDEGVLSALISGGPQEGGAHRVDERHQLRVELGHQGDGPRRVEECSGLKLPRRGARLPRVVAGTAAAAAAAHVLLPALQRHVARAGEHGGQRLQAGDAARG